MPPRKIVPKEIEDELDRLYPAPSHKESDKDKRKRLQNRRAQQKRLLDKYEKEQSEKKQSKIESVTESIEIIEEEIGEFSISSRTRSKIQKIIEEEKVIEEEEEEKEKEEGPAARTRAATKKKESTKDK